MVQSLSISWVIIVGIRATVHSHKVLPDTHTQRSESDRQVSVYDYSYYVYMYS